MMKRVETYVVYVSGRCNCNCHYCYLKTGGLNPKLDYDFDTDIKPLLDNIKKSTEPFVIEFLGGDPIVDDLSVLNLIKTVNYFPTGQPFIITTNGTRLPNEILELLKSNPNIYWAASMDGTKWANQLRITKDGYNTYDLVMENIKTLKMNNIPDKQIGIHLITHPYNIAFLEQSIDHLYKKGIRNFGIGTVESTMKIGYEYCSRFIYELNQVSTNICNGKYPEIGIDLFNGIKPREDIRQYIHDGNGNIIGESYGRNKDDFTQTDTFNVQKCDNTKRNLIQEIREEVYWNHQDNLKKRLFHNK
jgi:sulfatase maturation enzyme AslB (radical SAM superfamily)